MIYCNTEADVSFIRRVYKELPFFINQRFTVPQRLRTTFIRRRLHSVLILTQICIIVKSDFQSFSTGELMIALDFFVISLFYQPSNPVNKMIYTRLLLIDLARTRQLNNSLVLIEDRDFNEKVVLALDT